MTVHDDRKFESITGSILIFTLWILVCLSLMSLGLGHRVRLETKATTYTVANTEAFYIAETALYAKLIELASLGESNDDARPRKSAGKKPQKEEAVIRYEVISEEGKVNINRTPEDLIKRVKFLKGNTVWMIMNRRRSEDMKPDTGDRGLFLLPEELLVEAKIDPEDWYGREKGKPGIRDLITVYGTGLIDVNSAPLEVLEAIPGVSSGVVENIIVFRAGPDGKQGSRDDRKWRTVGQLKESLELSSSDVGPIGKYCRFGSEFYTVTVTARKKGSRATARISVVARIEDNEFEVVSWREH